MNDHEILFVLGPLVVLLAIACETLWRNRLIPQWVARKLLHVGAVGACALAPLWLEDLALLRWIVILSEVVLLWLVLKGYFFNQSDGRRSWGIVLFPLSYLLLLFVEPERWVITLAMAVLAFSDAIAAAVGNLWGHERYSLTGDHKTLAGSTAFFITTLILLRAFPLQEAMVTGLPLWQQWALLAGISLLLTAIEALGSRGFDNLFIPLAAWLLIDELSAMPYTLRGELALHLIWGCLWALVFIPMVIRLKWLDLGGAIAAAIIGLWVLYFAGPWWLLPLFLFLAGGTLIGRLVPRNGTRSVDAKQGHARDAVQVLCNGGVYAVVAAVFDHPLASIAMAVSIAISAADTWASEIGLIFRSATRDILRWRRVPPGLSGGVSLPGTTGALAGAVLFGIVGARMMHVMELFWPLMVLITLGGMLGMMLDSLLGSALQPRYRLADGSLADVPRGHATKISGHRWMSNDMVNLLSNASITGLVILALEAMHGLRHHFSAAF